MKLKGIFAVAAASIAVVGTVGCQPNELPTVQSNYFNSMNTVAQITIPEKIISDNRESYDNLLSETAAILSQVENSISTTKEESYISRFNSLAAGGTMEIDKISFEVLTVAKNMFDLTDGYYNPAVYYSVADYGFNGSDKPQIADEFISSEVAAKYVTLAESFSLLALTESEGKYYVTKPQTAVEIDGVEYSMKIDLGGIGKGYATDLVDGLFQKYGFKYGLFNFGSSSISIKKYYSGSSDEYTLAMTNPRGSGTYVKFKIKDKKISTSGDYENYYILGGERYCHIINPKTARPIANKMMTATLIGGSAAENDALTTAIMAMGIDGATAFMQSLTDRQVIFSFEEEGYKFRTNLTDATYEITNSEFTKF